MDFWNVLDQIENQVVNAENALADEHEKNFKFYVHEIAKLAKELEQAVENM